MISSDMISTQETVAQDSARDGRRRLLWIVYLLSFAILVWFFVEGFDYYMTPYTERPHHPDYRGLRPAGSRGLAYGIAGSVMMVMMLVYSLRKRTRLLGRSLPLRPLLDFHIYLGIIGPLFIVLHTSLKVQGLVAVSFWSMVAVAASGFFGRYLYLQIPRNIAGKELTLQEMEQTSADTAGNLKARFKLDDITLGQVDALFEKRLIPRGNATFAAILSLMIDDLIRPVVKSKLRRQLLKIVWLPRDQFRDLFETSFTRALLRRRIHLLGQVQRLFHYWHVIHKPFAIIMYFIMAIHIGIAIWTGYGWIS
ncbi:MAG: hypothetical protein AB1772_02885 [Candidatus Zixiibacteriota bacterium]